MTAVAALYVLSLILLEYFQEGVRSHHLLARRDLPAISNWWGLLILPVLTWIGLTLIQKRLIKANNDEMLEAQPNMKSFISAFLFGIVMTLLYYNAPALPGYFMLTTFALALFIPIYRPEYWLGFILSMAYGFGGVLPVIFSLILVPIYLIEYRLIRKGFLLVLSKSK